MFLADFFRNLLPQSLYAKFYRIGLNFWPCIRATGGRVIYISDDFMQLTVRLRLKMRTRNIVGTIFGGAMYSSTDPMFMLMLLEILGKNFVVWDKGCTIRFKKPATKDIYAHFEITPSMLADVKEQVATLGEYSFTWRVEYKDKSGQVYCELDKLMYVATKEFYKQKLSKRNQS